MTNLTLIQEKIPQELQQLAQTFTIPDEFLTTMSDLIVLILQSKSMDTQEEKQSWFNLLPMMNKDQIDKLRDILTREKQKLNEIEQKYTSKKQELTTKYTQKWENMAYAKKIEEIKKQEAQHEQIEDQQADDLLNQL